MTNPELGLTGTTELRGLLNEYSSALKALPALRETNFNLGILSILLLRDRIASCLTTKMTANSEEIQDLYSLDKDLKAFALSFRKAVYRSTFAEWREVTNPPEFAFWWWLDRYVAERSLAATILPFIGLAMLGATLAVATEIVRRFFVGGPDLWGAAYLFFQAIVTIAAGTAFTEAGGQWIERMLICHGVKRGSVLYLKFAGFTVGLLLACGLWIEMPHIATVYNASGEWSQSKGNNTSAIAQLQRAVALDPDYTAAHYNLGSAYEDIGEYDKALTEYQTAIRTDARYIPAYNNAAHLLLLRKRDYGGALTLLEEARSRISTDELEASIRYSLWKNLAWAHFGLHHLRQASSEIEDVIHIDPRRAEGYCLKAQIAEGLREKEVEVLPLWRQCVSLRPPTGDSDASWYSIAEERLH